MVTRMYVQLHVGISDCC